MATHHSLADDLRELAHTADDRTGARLARLADRVGELEYLLHEMYLFIESTALAEFDDSLDEDGRWIFHQHFDPPLPGREDDDDEDALLEGFEELDEDAD